MAKERVQRRLAAILSADVEGYSRLMHADEDGTLRLLNSHRAIIDRLIDEYGGRIANTSGDGVLAEFPSAVDGLKCALEIAERLSEVNFELPRDSRVNFRFGLHVGDVAVKDGDLFGDSVNVAARLQQIALPGTVYLSETVHQFVHKTLPLKFADFGIPPIKNIDMPVRVYVVQPGLGTVSHALPSVHRRSTAHLARRFHELCTRALSGVTRQHDLVPVDFAVLASLDDASTLDLGRLAERTGLTRKRLRTVIKRLVASDLATVTSARNDATITAKGIKLVQDLRPAIKVAQDRVLAALSNRERDLLQELLSRVITTGIARGIDKIGT